MSEETTQFILGDAAVDALKKPGRRLFRRRKKPKQDSPPLTHCENCGATLTGEYCAQCGQHAIDYRRSLLRVAVDAADSVFNWDTKFITSVAILLVKPWRLTNDFNAGRRTRYLHPLRMYLLASIAFFLLAKQLNVAPNTGPRDLNPEKRAEIEAKLANFAGPDSVFNDEQKAQIEKVRGRLAAAGALSKDERVEFRKVFDPKEGASPIPKTWRKQRADLKEVISDIPTRTPAPAPAKAVDPNFIGPMPEATPATEAPPQPDRGIHVRMGTPPPGTGPLQFDVHDDDKPDEQKEPFERWLESRIKDKVGTDGTKAKLFVETLRSNLPTMMLCCIPLFAFVLKVLYIRSRRFYIEHLVYALHVHTFVYVAVVVITLVTMLTDRLVPSLRGWLLGLLVVFAVVQVFLSIRRVYRDNWFFTAFKFFLGGVAYFIILIFAVTATAFVTLILPD